MTVQPVPDYYCSTVYMYSIRSGEFRLLSLVVGIQGWGGEGGGILDQYLDQNHSKSKLLR